MKVDTKIRVTVSLLLLTFLQLVAVGCTIIVLILLALKKLNEKLGLNDEMEELVYK